MRVLVTNDDGVQAEGLRILAGHLVKQGHEVLVVAPSSDRSGSSAGLGPMHDGAAVAVTRYELDGLPDIPVHALDAPPGMCALAACAGLFGPAPDVVVSGVNAGWNTGRGVLHSGTVGAAVTAAAAGVPSLAVSCGPLPTARFDSAAWLVSELLPSVLGLPAGVALNLNVPDLDPLDIAGMVEGGLGGTGLHSVRLQYADDQLRVSERVRRTGVQPDSDGDLVLRGYASITALRAAPTTVNASYVVDELNNRLTTRHPDEHLEDA